MTDKETMTRHADDETLEYIAQLESQLAAANARLAGIVEENKRLREALAPFSHPDLSEKLGGNHKGDESPVFARNKALLTLGNFRQARAALAHQSEQPAGGVVVPNLSKSNAIGYLSDLVEALNGAFISSWQSTAAWQKQLDAAKDFLAAAQEPRFLDSDGLRRLENLQFHNKP